MKKGRVILNILEADGNNILWAVFSYKDFLMHQQ
jgi:hypothetical protein